MGEGHAVPPFVSHKRHVDPDTLTCQRCGGLVIKDVATDYREGVKCDYWRCLLCGRPAHWNPIQSMYTSLDELIKKSKGGLY